MKRDDAFIPSKPLLRAMIDGSHPHGITVASFIPQVAEKEEACFKPRELGRDAFSGDCPSVMSSVIKKLQNRAKK